jgi:Mrp family chromosome partitioning ATPase
MGLFSAATMRSKSPESPPPKPGHVGVFAPAEPHRFDPLPPVGGDELELSADLETSLDLLWTRLRQQYSVGRPDGHRAFVTAHWAPDEGATTIAAGLAYRAAQLDPTATFCVADFDFFDPALSYLWGLESEVGISNVLCGQAQLDAALAPTRLSNLFVAPAGYPNVGRRVAQLHDRCRELCTMLLARFHYVFLDIPCLREHLNYALWAGGIAESMLVVRAGQARREAVAKALRTLHLMQLPPAAVALNGREYHVPNWLYART